ILAPSIERFPVDLNGLSDGGIRFSEHQHLDGNQLPLVEMISQSGALRGIWGHVLRFTVAGCNRIWLLSNLIHFITPFRLATYRLQSHCLRPYSIASSSVL